MPQVPDASALQVELRQQRLAKLQRLRALGIDPYPAHFHRSHTNAEAAALFRAYEAKAAGDGAPEVQVAGRVTALRRMGKATFVDLLDGSGQLQALLRQDRLAERYEVLKELDLGDFLGVAGPLFRTRTSEITVEAAGYTFLSKALQPPPEKWHGLADVEKRYRQRYLDLVANPEARHTFRVRSQVVSSIRRFLDGRGFLEVETPILQEVAAGALANPFGTHLEALHKDLYLRIATELPLKRLLVGGFDKVYELGRVFRNEGVDTRHNPEFTTLETYEAYADYHDVMNMLEEMVSTVCQSRESGLGTTKVPYQAHILDFTPPWPRVPLREALIKACDTDFERFRDVEALRSRMVGLGVSMEGRLSWGQLLDKLVSAFVEPTLVQPTFLLDYPVEVSPLAKHKPDEPGLVERFEAFAGGMEIANAFSELNDPLDQRQRFEQQEALRAALGEEAAERTDYDFLLAMEHGMPPAGGLGVGVDRLVMLLTNNPSIREVILFPQLKAKM
ncbi:MAG: lysine--tRNA ligase [Chloroflexi bacterium]|nr:lysine--tRNA ligase [Chloroflexota bacterium]